MALKKKYLGVDGYMGGLTEEVTPWGGVGLLIELIRRVGVDAVMDQNLGPKRSGKWLTHGHMAEAFVLLSALGGECVDDFEHLRGDVGLRAITGFEMPPPSTARQWLDKAHEEELIEKAKEDAQQQNFLSYIPAESRRLHVAGKAQARTIGAAIKAMKPDKEVTMDVDAHLTESHKQSALKTYEGYPGFQPMIVLWAEMNLILKDEFRNGNVPASKDIKRVVDEAYNTLPAREDGEAWKVSVRSDSAAYEQEVLDHWHSRGWRFGVSADMSRALHEEVLKVGEGNWSFWKEERGGTICEWAEVPYVPSRPMEKKGTDVPIYRYVAVRVRKRQQEFFADGSCVKHFVLVTNIENMDGDKLLEWHRGKAGTVEHAHNVLTNELAAGVYPSGKFGVDALWLRMQVITFNLLELLKAAVLDERFRKARPKKLRFAVFTQWARVVRHAGRNMVRLATKGFDEIIRPGQTRLRALEFSSP